jgi:hypothetical protein
MDGFLSCSSVRLDLASVADDAGRNVQYRHTDPLVPLSCPEPGRASPAVLTRGDDPPDPPQLPRFVADFTTRDAPEICCRLSAAFVPVE